MPRPSAKAKLLEAAMTSFWANGFKACTIEDIADRAGVFKGSFYNHFKSKEALSAEVVKLYVTEGYKTISLDGPGSPLKRLKKHFELLAVVQAKPPFRDGCLLANFSAEVSDSNPELRAALNEGVEHWCRAIAKLIRQAQAAGEISKRYKPDLLARFVVNAWEGATIRLKVVRNRQPVDDFFDAVFKGILAPPKD